MTKAERYREFFDREKAARVHWKLVGGDLKALKKLTDEELKALQMYARREPKKRLTYSVVTTEIRNRRSGQAISDLDRALNRSLDRALKNGQS